MELLELEHRHEDTEHCVHGVPDMIVELTRLTAASPSVALTGTELTSVLVELAKLTDARHML